LNSRFPGQTHFALLRREVRDISMPLSPVEVRLPLSATERELQRPDASLSTSRCRSLPSRCASPSMNPECQNTRRGVLPSLSRCIPSGSYALSIEPLEAAETDISMPLSPVEVCFPYHTADCKGISRITRQWMVHRHYREWMSHRPCGRKHRRDIGGGCATSRCRSLLSRCASLSPQNGS